MNLAKGWHLGRGEAPRWVVGSAERNLRLGKNEEQREQRVCARKSHAGAESGEFYFTQLELRSLILNTICKWFCRNPVL